MYNRDVKLIQQHILKTGSQGIVDVFSTVIATIRTSFKDITKLSEDIRANKHSSKALWGHKIDSYLGVVENKDNLYDLFESSAPEKIMLQEVLKIKGLGLAKASFAMQMMGYNVACLDTHNLKKLGYSSSYFNNKKKAEEYLQVVKKEGAEYWWNTWCELIPTTERNRKYFKTADEVSYEHVRAVRGY
jgi:hypothetical protein